MMPVPPVDRYVHTAVIKALPGFDTSYATIVTNKPKEELDNIKVLTLG